MNIADQFTAPIALQPAYNQPNGLMSPQLFINTPSANNSILNSLTQPAPSKASLLPIQNTLPTWLEKSSAETSANATRVIQQMTENLSPSNLPATGNYDNAFWKEKTTIIGRNRHGKEQSFLITNGAKAAGEDFYQELERNYNRLPTLDHLALVAKKFLQFVQEMIEQFKDDPMDGPNSIWASWRRANMAEADRIKSAVETLSEATNAERPGAKAVKNYWQFYSLLNLSDTRGRVDIHQIVASLSILADNVFHRSDPSHPKIAHDTQGEDFVDYINKNLLYYLHTQNSRTIAAAAQDLFPIMYVAKLFSQSHVRTEIHYWEPPKDKNLAIFDRKVSEKLHFMMFQDGLRNAWIQTLQKFGYGDEKGIAAIKNGMNETQARRILTQMKKNLNTMRTNLIKGAPAYDQQLRYQFAAVETIGSLSALTALRYMNLQASAFSFRETVANPTSPINLFYKALSANDQSTIYKGFYAGLSVSFLALGIASMVGNGISGWKTSTIEGILRFAAQVNFTFGNLIRNIGFTAMGITSWTLWRRHYRMVENEQRIIQNAPLGTQLSPLPPVGQVIAVTDMVRIYAREGIAGLTRYREANRALFRGENVEWAVATFDIFSRATPKTAQNILFVVGDALAGYSAIIDGAQGRPINQRGIILISSGAFRLAASIVGLLQVTLSSGGIKEPWMRNLSAAHVLCTGFSWVLSSAAWIVDKPVHEEFRRR